ncbi:MAG: hypothetical protein ACM358_17060 [Gemmatimonadota bacterium]
MIDGATPAAFFRVAHRVVPVLIEPRPEMDGHHFDLYGFRYFDRGRPVGVSGPNGPGPHRTLAGALASIERLLRGGFRHCRYLVVLRGAP